MTEQATAQKPTTSQAIIIPIKGRIHEVYEHKKRAGGFLYETIVILPAPNEYDSPLRLTIKSNEKELGVKGDMVNIKVNLSSRYWKNPKDNKVSYNPELWLNE